MTKSWVAIGSVLLLGLALVTSAVALQEDNAWFRQRAASMFVTRAERELNLTVAQREQIRTILKTEQLTIEALAARVRRQQELLNSTDTFDEAAVRAFARAHVATTEDVLVEREKIRVEIMQVLTPDQRIEAAHIRQRFSAQLADRLSTIGDTL